MNTMNWKTRRRPTFENLCHQSLQMHHVRHIKKDKGIGFPQILKQLNRTMIPLWRTDHWEVHKGKYDDRKFQEFYGVERFFSEEFQQTFLYKTGKKKSFTNYDNQS